MTTHGRERDGFNLRNGTNTRIFIQMPGMHSVLRTKYMYLSVVLPARWLSRVELTNSIQRVLPSSTQEFDRVGTLIIGLPEGCGHCRHWRST